MRKIKAWLALSLLVLPSLAISNRNDSACFSNEKIKNASAQVVSDTNEHVISVNIVNKDTIIYTGEACKPAVNVYDYTIQQDLVLDQDYVLEYKGDLVNAGTNEARVIVNFKTIEHSPITCYYSILPRPVNVVWPSDNFVENGKIQSINPYYFNVKYEKVDLLSIIRKDGVVTDFIKPGVYEVEATELNHDSNYKIANTTHEYLMRWLYQATTDTIDDLPIAIAYSDYGVDPYLHLEASVVNPVEQSDKYNRLVDKLKEDPTFSTELDKVFAIYDTALVDQYGIHHKTETNVSMSVLIPKEVRNANVRVYRVSVDEVRLVKYDVFDGDYVSVGMIDFDNFAIVYSYEDLTWLIITLSVVIALLILAFVLIVTYHGMRVSRRRTK